MCNSLVERGVLAAHLRFRRHAFGGPGNLGPVVLLTIMSVGVYYCSNVRHGNESLNIY